MITARLNEPLTNQNLIYCATVNLTWNELSMFMKGKITFESSNEVVDFLNQQSFTKEHLDEKCYLAYASFIKDGILERIKKDLKEKFNETSKVNLSDEYNPSDILAYSFLLKVLTFEKKFENLNEHLYFSGELVEAFGLKKVKRDVEKKLKNQVYILYYNNPDDFSISLRTQSEDTIVLVKTAPTGTMEDIIKKAESSEASEVNGGYRLQPDESLIIPKIEFDLEHHFKEMIGQFLYVNGVTTPYYIGDAVQFIKFLLNEEGAKLRSEMAMTLRKCFVQVERNPRQFVFDKPFLIYLKEKRGGLPYFAAWVSDTTLLKKKEVKGEERAI